MPGLSLRLEKQDSQDSQGSNTELASPYTPTSVASADNGLDNNICCFVCEVEGGRLLQVCKCTDRWIHLECQQKLMQRTPAHQAGCPICRTSYVNVQELRAKKRLTNDGRRMLCYISGVGAVFLISLYEMVMFAIEGHLGFLIVSIVFLLSALIFGWFGYKVFRRTNMYHAGHVSVTLSDRQRETPASPSAEPVSTSSTTT